MRIVKITTLTDNKTKLVTAEPLLNLSGYEVPGNPIFFTYANGVLKQFAGNMFQPVNAPIFKDALKHIQSL